MDAVNHYKRCANSPCAKFQARLDLRIYFLTELVLQSSLSPEPHYQFRYSWTGGGQEELMWVIFSSFLWSLEQHSIKARRQF